VEEQRYLFINDVVKRMANAVYSEGARTLILSVSAGAISSIQLNHFYLLFFSATDFGIMENMTKEKIRVH